MYYVPSNESHEADWKSCDPVDVYKTSEATTAIAGDTYNDRSLRAGRTAGKADCLPPGYRLREFAVESVLGEGGFGVVYAATDTRLERHVAIKEYMPASLATRAADLSLHARSSLDQQEAFSAGLRSFINEAKLLARFQHPSLVKVYQFWEERGTAYMVMPLYTAPTFKSWLRQRVKPVEEKWLISFLAGLIDALEALHRENCLHRDVAPDNILVLNDSEPLLLDFGAARRFAGDLTHNLTAIVKPGFAPVEQYADTSTLKQGPWTDVYALAAVGYYAITGTPPVPALARIIHDELAPLRELVANRYSHRLIAALDAGMRVLPGERLPSMQALRTYLFGEASATDHTTVLVPPSTLLSPAPPMLRSTFNQNSNARAVDEDATRINTNGTVEPRCPSRRHRALLWVGSFAAGAALAHGIAAWPGRASEPPPAQLSTASETKAMWPTVSDLVPAKPTLPTPQPSFPGPENSVDSSMPTTPAPTPSLPQPSTHAAPPRASRAEPTTASTAPTVAEKKAPGPAAQTAPVKPSIEVPKAAEGARAEAAAPTVRDAPEGTGPLAISDAGLIGLQLEGTFNVNDKAPLFDAYTCCNLHYSSDWTSDLNYSGETLIPAGSPIKIVDYGRSRLIVVVGGKKIGIGLEHGRRHETLAQFARKLTIDKDLRFRLAAFPSVVQDAIYAAKVLPGMTREQVLIAAGFPARHETPTIGATAWKFWYSSRVPYIVHFDEHGRVKEIEVDPAERGKVVYAVK